MDQKIRGGIAANDFSGRTIDVPSLFIAGENDCGVFIKAPETWRKMQKTACTRMLRAHLVDGAGHWSSARAT